MARPRTSQEVLPGDVIGELTVLDCEEWRDKSNRLRRRYNVVCSCGNKETRTEQGLIRRVYVRCRECIRKRNQRSLAYRGVSRVCDSYKESARVRGLEFSLSREQVESLVTKECFYCSAPPSSKRLVQTKDGDEYFEYNGIDRVDSSIGYVSDNVVTCCSKCNYGKRTLSQQEFYEWAVAVVETMKQRGLDSTMTL